MPDPSDEKRTTRRFPSDVRLRFTHATQVMEMDAVNLSIGGAYCSSQRRFLPMTRLEVRLDLPGQTRSSGSITATAVVVRVDDGPPGGHCRLALWFQEMAREDRARLRRHLGIDGH